MSYMPKIGGAVALGLLMLIASAAHASEFFHFRTEDEWSKTGNSFYIGAFGGESAIILGSNEIRSGGGITFGYGRPDPKLRIWSIPAQNCLELSVDSTHGRGSYESTPNDRVGVNLLEYARYRFRTRHGVGFFTDLGFGFYFTKESFDIPSPVSFTPTAGIGVAIRNGRASELIIGLRFRHISNAGIRGTNNGQNGFWLTVGERF